jgi:hypothetical protein
MVDWLAKVARVWKCLDLQLWYGEGLGCLLVIFAWAGNGGIVKEKSGLRGTVAAALVWLISVRGQLW